MKISQLVILSVVLSITLHSAYGQVASSITVNTDKIHYSDGDIIYISGSVSEILFGEDINLMVLAPNGNLISIDKLIVDSNKIFQTELTYASELIKSSGTYTILAIYGSDNTMSNTTFSFDSISKATNQDAPEKEIQLKFDFIDTYKKVILEHIDYKITVSKNGADIFGPIPLTHASVGKISIPMTLGSGQSYDILIEVHGILFKKIPTEKFSFSIMPESEIIHSQIAPNSTLKIKLAINQNPSGESQIIPEWLKNNAKWWANGLIDDDTFVQGTQYMIREKIVDISNMPYPATWMDKSIPEWIKNNASWWADDLIPESEYIKGIKYLVEKGVIQV
ncbi:MAG: hypothetical protein OEQ12_02625 [Nitrosopumilus sp.]|nr:hypothetical protein [Nitrosopumilus sp.]